MIKFYSRTFFSFLFILCWGFVSYSQVLITPIIKNYPTAKKGNNSTKRTLATPLKLPFFDDFSTSSERLTDSLWQKGGGTYINNTRALNPPSFNVVTFDGVDSTGRPYNNFEDPLRTDTTDHLTSHPIDLSGLNASSNVYLSFMWQAEGLGEEPDNASNNADSLSLFFLANDNIWYPQWSARGQSVQPFKNAIVPIIDTKDTKFLWNGFQFKLVARGNLSGPFDNWHVDYFYLNKDRTKGLADTTFEDVAISKTPPSFLKRYSSMPYYQYLKNPAGETLNNLSLSFFNIRPMANRPEGNLLIVKENVLVYSTIKNTAPSGTPSYQFDSIPFTVDYNNLIGDDVGIDEAVSKKNFLMKYYLDTGSVKGRTTNDTIIRSVNFDNYYAYDDGSAEVSFAVTGIGSRVAYRYHLNEQAKIIGVNIHLPQQIRDLAGSDFRLLIWNNKDDVAVKRITLAAGSEPGIDQFRKYVFDSDDRILLEDTFYIGYEQTSLNPLSIGFDRNTTSNEHIFYQIPGAKEWTKFTKVSGSLMIRPVFEIPDLTTSTKDPITIKPYKLYPNPTKGLVLIDGAAITKVGLYDNMGREMNQTVFKPGAQKEINLQGLTNGVYILHVFKGKERFVEKVILQK